MKRELFREGTRITSLQWAAKTAAWRVDKIERLWKRQSRQNLQSQLRNLRMAGTQVKLVIAAEASGVDIEEEQEEKVKQGRDELENIGFQPQKKPNFDWNGQTRSEQYSLLCLLFLEIFGESRATGQ